jgi:hypothetical protein
MTDKTIRSIECDYCGKELIVDSSYPHHYVLELRAIDTGINTSGLVYGVALDPPFKKAKHFCNKTCLGGWVNDERP